jgi:hypothetical protein
MPQIPAAAYHDMFKYLEKHGVRSKAERVDPKSLTPMQKLNMDKVRGMMGNPRSLDKPILVDRKGKLVDGHHRWGAAKGLDMDVNIIRLNADFEKIRDLFADFEKTEYKGLHEEMEKSVLVENLSPALQNVVKALGGPNRVKIMTGATLVVDNAGETVTIAGIKRAPVTHIVITYSHGRDLFDLTGYKMRGVDMKPVRSQKDVYVGDLVRTLEGWTGLAFRLA